MARFPDGIKSLDAPDLRVLAMLALRDERDPKRPFRHADLSYAAGVAPLTAQKVRARLAELRLIHDKAERRQGPSTVRAITLNEPTGRRVGELALLIHRVLLEA